MKISARNQVTGTVKTVTEGAVMSEVVVEIPIAFGRAGERVAKIPCA